MVIHTTPFCPVCAFRNPLRVRESNDFAGPVTAWAYRVALLVSVPEEPIRHCGYLTVEMTFPFPEVHDGDRCRHKEKVAL
ncbi:hypothetical protein MBT84_29305 [Streptomyces sp. MBT84]|nr:hypothetical protein [Streptomyces sp. MBT84]